MHIATPTPKLAVSQREPSRKFADHPQFIAETYIARLWTHSGPLHRYGCTPPLTDPASATRAITLQTHSSVQRLHPWHPLRNNHVPIPGSPTPSYGETDETGPESPAPAICTAPPPSQAGPPGK